MNLIKNKTALILAYDFPPYVSVGGLRPYAWYKYLKDFGVYPVVVTRQWSNEHGSPLDYISSSKSKDTITEQTEFGTIIRTPYKPNLANRLMLKYGNNKYRFLRRIISAYYEFAQWLFFIGPKSNLYYGAKEYLSKNNVDIIIATGDPFVLFSYAAKLSNKFKTPWIADYRDPWTQNMANNRNAITKFWSAHFEKKLTNSACAITTVSEFVQNNISNLVINKNIYIIPNGYDPEAIDKVKTIEQTSDELSIGFVGTIYNWHPVDSFLAVVSKFLTIDPLAKVKVNFYGVNIADHLNDIIKSKYSNISKNIEIFPKMQNEKLLQRLAKDNLMLLFNYYCYMGTKIFDYIGINRAILLCYSDDAEAKKLKEMYFTVDNIEGLSNHLQEDLILETQAGYVVKDSDHLLVVLDNLYSEFIRSGKIQSKTINTEQFSRRSQTQVLAEIINKTIIDKTQNYQICNRCVMDSSDVDITFDEKGNCNHCNNYFQKISHRVYRGEESDKQLLSLIATIKKHGKNKKYDCIIGVSGGIDSSYVAYKAKKRGLRALLVHLDNGWNSEISVKNIKNLADILSFDYESFVLDWEEFKDLQLSFLRASVPEMETPTDIAIIGALHQVAAKYKVKYIISGGNFATEGILPKTWHYNAKDFKYFKFIQKKYGTKKIRKFPFLGWKEESYYKFIKGIKMVYILNYIPYNKQEAMNILQNELGWRYYGGKHYESKYTGFVQSYIMPVKFNMDYRRATFSTQICTGEITREWALEELNNPSFNKEILQSEKEYVCKKLGIKPAEFDNMMTEKAKIYRDFPNAEARLEFIYKLYRKIFKKPGYRDTES